MSPRILVWFWSGGGGGSQFAVNLAHRLAVEFGADAITLSMRDDDGTIAAAEARGLRVLRANIVSDRRRPLASMAGLSQSGAILERHIRESGADLVCVAMNFAVAAPLSLMLRLPIIYCAHDPDPHPGDFEVVGQRVTQALLLQRAGGVVALSRHSAARLATMPGVGAKQHLAPLSSVFAPKVAASPAQRDEPVRLLMTGRMIAYKGLDLLADALAAIAHRRDWSLTIAGAGPAFAGSVPSRFSGPQISNVRREWLSDVDIERLFAETDVVLAPYVSATQSGVVAQALAWGKPVVVTPVGALPEQIGDGAAGWVASAASAAAYAQALVVMLDDPGARAAKAVGGRALSEAAWRGDYWSWLNDWRRA